MIQEYRCLSPGRMFLSLVLFWPEPAKRNIFLPHGSGVQAHGSVESRYIQSTAMACMHVVGKALGPSLIVLVRSRLQGHAVDHCIFDKLHVLGKQKNTDHRTDAFKHKETSSMFVAVLVCPASCSQNRGTKSELSVLSMCVVLVSSHL